MAWTAAKPEPALPCPRALYQALRAGPPDDATRAQARRFLDAMLARVADQPGTLPRQATALSGWLRDHHESTGRAFQRYLHQRREGAPRQFFPHRAQAFYFLRHVAPTKLVDGAWLYAVLARWRDPRFSGLVRIYLEELGDGLPRANHVLMFWRLLAQLDCDPGGTLPPRYYRQGALQLCLGWLGGEYLPEMVGFNLGYEQLPLHLLITVCELRELGIDARYFTEHVAIDNADSGHARHAMEAVGQLFGACPDRDTHARLCRGLALNSLGPGSLDIVQECDLAREVQHIFRRKQCAGRAVHGDHCRLAGEPVSAWLADPARVPVLLQRLRQAGWLAPGRTLGETRFGRLVVGRDAPMAGVFSGYEQTVLAGWLGMAETALPDPVPVPDAAADTVPEMAPEELLPWLSPARHFTPEGLQATRAFRRHCRGQ